MESSREPQYPSLTPGDMATWSRLTFQSYRDGNWEIYQANGDGSVQSRLTTLAQSDSTPRFNRDATRIAFVSNRTGSYQIFSMNSDGSNVTQLTFTSANNYNPSWSPDGSQLVFNSYRDGQSEIYVMKADGSQPVRLTTTPSYEGQPVWSPDGTRVAFTSDSGTPANTGNRIWLMNANGSGQIQLSTQFWSESPNWSPDGTQIAYDADGNNDGWQEIWVMNSNGTGQQFKYQPPEYQTDAWVRSWSPNGQYIAFTRLTWTYNQGNWYWTTAYLDAFDTTSGTVVRLSYQSEDWHPDWKTTDITAPASQVTIWSPWSYNSGFDVNWSGTDPGGSQIKSYDVQYRDSASGPWIDWQLNTPDTSAMFTGQYGHTYYFRSRARDNAGNVEAYPDGDGDAFTTPYTNALIGHVLGNREQPIVAAATQSNPAALNTGLSRHDGQYELYYGDSSSAVDVTITRAGFGQLPPIRLVATTGANPAYLPPIDDQLLNGQFENGDLSDWSLTGEVSPTLSNTGYSGSHAVQLGHTAPITAALPWTSAIEQTINVPPTLTQGTFSLIYKILEADSVGDTLLLSLIGPTSTLTYSLPTGGANLYWTHHWWDVSAWEAPTATVRIEFTHNSFVGQPRVLFDDLSWGSMAMGGVSVYLPVIRR